MVTYSKPCDALQHGVKLKGLLRRRVMVLMPHLDFSTEDRFEVFLK